MIKNYDFKYKYKIFLCGALIGAVIFLLIYGFSILNFTNDSLIINGYIEKDIAQHYAGWMLYRNSPWQFPLGVGKNIAFPYGSAVSYTDSIPLFAIFFKLFRDILPATFQYFGLFCLLSFMMQGAFGALLSSLFSKNCVVNLMCAVLFTFSPIMIERAFRHCALSAHFLILSALYYYFQNKGVLNFKSVLPFIIINCLAITIHPYFLPFTFGIMFAFCIESFVLQKKYVQSICYIFFSILLTLFIGYSIGAFYIGGDMASSGYGLFSMNLNALHNPISRGISNWSSILEIKPQETYQIEGFNFLGLGVMCFIPVSGIICLFTYKNKLAKTVFYFIKHYFGIIFSTLSLLIFALGDWVVFGGLRLFRLPIPQFLMNSICGVFRANGRFGWLLVYMLIILIVFMLSKISIRKSYALFIILIFIQVFDMRNALITKHAYFTHSAGDLQGQVVSSTIKNSFWDDAADKYEFGHMISSNVNHSCIDLAVKFGKKCHVVNTAFEARVNKEKITKENDIRFEEINNGTLDNNTIVLVNEISDEMKDVIHRHGLSAFYVDNIYVICHSKFSDSELNKYISEGNFIVL